VYPPGGPHSSPQIIHGQRLFFAYPDLLRPSDRSLLQGMPAAHRIAYVQCQYCWPVKGFSPPFSPSETQLTTPDSISLSDTYLSEGSSSLFLPGSPAGVVLTAPSPAFRQGSLSTRYSVHTKQSPPYLLYSVVVGGPIHDFTKQPSKHRNSAARPAMLKSSSHHHFPSARPSLHYSIPHTRT
jgi:hypothetical protein